MIHAAYILAGINCGFMISADGDLGRSLLFLTTNLWLMLAVYLTHKTTNNHKTET